MLVINIKMFYKEVFIISSTFCFAQEETETQTSMSFLRPQWLALTECEFRNLSTWKTEGKLLENSLTSTSTARVDPGVNKLQFCFPASCPSLHSICSPFSYTVSVKAFALLKWNEELILHGKLALSEKEKSTAYLWSHYLIQMLWLNFYCITVDLCEDIAN